MSQESSCSCTTSCCLCNLTIDRFFSLSGETGCKDKGFSAYPPNFSGVFLHILQIFPEFFFAAPFFSLARRPQRQGLSACHPIFLRKSPSVTLCQHRGSFRHLPSASASVRPSSQPPRLSFCQSRAASVSESGCKSTAFFRTRKQTRGFFWGIFMSSLQNICFSTGYGRKIFKRREEGRKEGHLIHYRARAERGRNDARRADLSSGHGSHPQGGRDGRDRIIGYPDVCHRMPDAARPDSSRPDGLSAESASG